MSLKDQARFVGQKLSNIAIKQGSTYQNVATEFLIERLVVRLTASPKLFSSLIFKGGYVGLSVYESPRYTIDLDALLVKMDLHLSLELIKKAAETDQGDCVWFKMFTQATYLALT